MRVLSFYYTRIEDIFHRSLVVTFFPVVILSPHLPSMMSSSPVYDATCLPSPPSSMSSPDTSVSGLCHRLCCLSNIPSLRRRPCHRSPCHRRLRPHRRLYPHCRLASSPSLYSLEEVVVAKSHLRGNTNHQLPEANRGHVPIPFNLNVDTYRLPSIYLRYVTAAWTSGGSC